MTKKMDDIPENFQEVLAEHVRRYEATGDVYSGPNEGQPTVILTTLGRRTGVLRKSPVVRIEHDGVYAAVAALAGAPKHPQWYLNLNADPQVRLQDGSDIFDMIARDAEGEERAIWWSRATSIWPDYDLYQSRTDRRLPVVLLEAPKTPARSDQP